MVDRLKNLGQARIGLLLLIIVFIVLAFFSFSRKDNSEEKKNSFTGVSQSKENAKNEATSSADIKTEKLANNYFIFSKEAYETARSYKRPIFLFFYANWCPTCAKQEQIVVDTFNSLEKNSIIGFRVNFNDNDTSSDEKDLAREFGVRYQHTMFVFNQDGEETKKFLGQTEKDTLTAAFNQVNTLR